MTVEEYFGDWLQVINQKELFKVTKKINNLYKRCQCTPDYHNIFKVFNITPYNELCLVSIGQDPFPQKGVATGIAFGNSKESVNLSPSLQLIKEAVINFEIPHNLINFDPSLEEWSKQGILLLNSALTVEVGKPSSHLVVWRDFIKSFLLKLSTNNASVIYILWGNTAKSFESYIKQSIAIYKMPHPAYYVRNNAKIPHSFFVEISNIIRCYFNKNIKWYKEEQF